jgi:hypothetical protein
LSRLMINRIDVVMSPVITPDTIDKHLWRLRDQGIAICRHFMGQPVRFTNNESANEPDPFADFKGFDR